MKEPILSMLKTLQCFIFIQLIEFKAYNFDNNCMIISVDKLMALYSINSTIEDCKQVSELLYIYNITLF